MTHKAFLCTEWGDIQATWQEEGDQEVYVKCNTKAKGEGIFIIGSANYMFK